MSDRTSGSAPELTVLFVAAMGGLGGPVKRLSTLINNLPSVYRVLIKPRSDLLDGLIRDLNSVEEHMTVGRSAQRSYMGALVLMMKIFGRVLSRRHPIDVIHANGIVEFALCWPAALILRTPVVTWVGNYEAPALIRRLSPLFRTVAERTRWNAVSATAAQAVADAGLMRRDDVQVVTNIVDPADVRPTEEIIHDEPRVRIGYLQVARWVKGFDLLPKVMEELRDLHDRVRFLVFTQRNREPGWTELASFPAELVEVRPRAAHVGDVYAQCDIVFSPSRRESFNRVVAEALATGTPVVASALQPVRDVVGEAGLLFPVDDVSAAADCLRRLINDPDLRASLGQAGLARSQAWLPAPVAAEFLAQYRTVAARHRSKRSH